MAYGSAAGVASITPRWASGGTFTTTTSPTLAHINAWIAEVSATLDVVLSDLGFTIPVTAVTPVLMLDGFVNGEVAAMADGVHGSGKYGPTSKSSGGKTRTEIIMSSVASFLKLYAAGIESAGAARTRSNLSGLGFRETDERGNATFPLVQREAFSPGWVNWDSE